MNPVPDPRPARIPLRGRPRGPALAVVLALGGAACAPDPKPTVVPADDDEDGAGDGVADGGIDSAGGDGGAGGDPAPVQVELGLGRLGFAPLEPEVGLVYGPQGGWHIEPAARVHGVSPEGLRLRWSAVDPTTGADLIYPVTSTLSARAVLPTDDGGWDRVGDLLIFDVDSDAEVLGRAVLVGAALLDPQEVVVGAAEAELTVVCCG